MPNSDLLLSQLSKLYENQLALEASIMELSNGVESRGPADVAENVRGALHTIIYSRTRLVLWLIIPSHAPAGVLGRTGTPSRSPPAVDPSSLW